MAIFAGASIGLEPVGGALLIMAGIFYADRPDKDRQEPEVAER